MSLRQLLVASALLGASLTARADTLFSLSGTFQSGAALGGTFELNETTGLADSINFIYNGASQNVVFTTIDVQRGGEFPNLYEIGASYENFNDVFLLFFPEVSLVGYTGSPLYSASNPYGPYLDDTVFSYSVAGGGEVDDNLFVGSVTPAANSITPEPSSLALLGTGMLGAIGLLRKRSA